MFGGDRNLANVRGASKKMTVPSASRPRRQPLDRRHEDHGLGKEGRMDVVRDRGGGLDHVDDFYDVERKCWPQFGVAAVCA